MDEEAKHIIQHGFDTLLEIHKQDLEMQRQINDKIEEINKSIKAILEDKVIWEKQ